MARFDLVIYDLDGTLVDSKLDLAHAVNAAREHMGLGPLDHELIGSYVGNGAPILMRRAMGPDTSEEDLQRALEFFLGYYGEHCLDYTTLYQGVSDSLARLSEAGVKQAVLTNKPVRVSKTIIQGLGVHPYLFQVYGGNSFQQKKPDPIGIHTLIAEAGAVPDRTLMVGDSSVDMQTARNAGVRAAGCVWGFQPESVLTDPPDWVIEEMREILPVVLSS